MPRNANQSKSSNYSLDFDGSNYISITDDPLKDGATNFTLSAWVKANGTVGGSDISFLQNWVSPHVFIIRYKEPNGNFQLYLNGAVKRIDVALSSLGLVNNNWNHIVLVNEYDNSQIKVYVNGTLQHTETSTQVAYPSNSTPLKIGGDYNYWDGQIDGVSIFDYALSQSQVTTLWGGGTSVSNPMALPSPPIAYYPLGGSAGAFQTPVNNNDKWLIENNAIGDYVFDFSISGNGYITVPDSTALEPQNLTVSFWINAGAQGNYEYYLEKGNFSYAVYTGNTTTSLIFFIYDGSSYYLSNALTNALDSNWHHIAFTYDGSQIIGYKDGVANTPVSASATILYDTNPLRLFSRGPSLGNHPSGKMSNAQIFNTALSATEVETLYNYGSPIRTLANIPQNSNLKAWYKLDATEIYNSTSTEWSVDNNQNPSAYPSSLYFDGNTNYISTATLSSFITNDVSVSAWVNFTTLPSSFDGAFLGMNNSFEEGLNFCSVGGVIRFTIEGYDTNYVANTVTLVAGQWYHFCGTWDGSTIELFTNGASQGTFAYNGSISTSRVLEIGRVYNNGYNIDGKISNVAIWNTGLKSAQVTEIYNNGTPSNLSSHSATSNLVSWYKLNNTTTGIEDSKGSNNGTNNGATEYAGFVNTLAGDSTGMSQSNLVQSDLQTVAPYSKYAMSFDATDYIEVDSTPILNGATSLSISAWCKIDNNVEEPICSLWVSAGNQQYLLRSNTSYGIQFYLRGSWGMQSEGTNQALTPGQWYHIVATWDGSFIYIYVNGSLAITPKAASGTLDTMTGQKDWIGRHSANYLDGDLSNVAYWKNTALNQSQVREIYNEGLPSNLHNFSGTAPTAWWQLGENSSYVGGWTFADEMPAGNNGTGYGLSETDLTNGVGTTANGSSTGMSVGALVGDAPYSTANAISTNMVVTSRVSGVSDAAITTGGTGYVTGTNIATTGGSGTNCTINITTVSGGVITAITINNGGSNYVIGDVLTISGGNGNSTITVSGLNTP